MNESPAPIKYCGTERSRNIEHRQARRAQCRDEQNELQSRHFWAMDIECLHGRSLSTRAVGTSVSDGEASVTAG